MKNWVRICLILVFIAVFLISGWMLLDYHLESRKEQAQYDQLAQIVAHNTPATTLPPETQSPEEAQQQATAPTEPSILPEYAELYAMNPDMVGWLQIDDTRVNYPVMQTPDRTDYYLYRNFYGQRSGYGCLYARESCNINSPSDNITIYGHNMKDGSMFADLLDYQDRDFWATHPNVRFSTLTTHHSYVIFAVFVTTANEGQGFSYHLFENAQNEEEFSNYVNQCKQLSLYDTGITPVYGDKLITLSTCEYTRNNGRLVVVAKRVI